MSERYLPCLACGKPITRSSGCDAMSGYGPAPYGATTFYTYGHYGSTFWDSFDGEQCVVIVCDDCLRAHPERVTFIRRVRAHPDVWQEFVPNATVPRGETSGEWGSGSG